MGDGVEIVITPRHIERVVYSLVIVALVVLLIVKWGGGSCSVDDNETTGAVLAAAADDEPAETDDTVATPTETDDLCSNDDKDQDETDTDCGGDICDPCPEFKFCNVDDDCESGWCKGSVKCVEPTCDDGEKNQDESNVDCGGTVCGGFFYDGECHEDPKPSYSGRVEVTITDVETSINEYDGNENAKIESIDFKVENGKPEDVILTAYFYAYDSSGSNIFGVDPYESGWEAERTLTSKVEIPLLETGEIFTHTTTLNEGKGRTLVETEPDDNYEIAIELRDDDGDLVNSYTWEN